jgi:hypothetical protein
MAIPWHKYATRYKSQRIEDTDTYTLFERDDKVKIHTIMVSYNEVGKALPSNIRTTFADADGNPLEVHLASSLYSITAVTIPVPIDNGLQASCTTSANIDIDIFITYTPAGT